MVFSTTNQGGRTFVCGLWLFFVLGKQGAKQIVEKREFPHTVSALRGIADYTARAIASIAFNEVVHSLATCEMSVCVWNLNSFFYCYRLSLLWIEMCYE